MIVLGTPIVYTHRADVVRLSDDFSKPPKSEWTFQGKGGSSRRPGLHRHGDGYVVTFVSPGIRNEPAELAVEPHPTDNKSVMVWPDTGSGVVTGLVSRKVGRSVGPGGGSNIYGEGEWEPGWFEARASVNLYVVRWELKGTEFAFVPTWAAKPMGLEVV